MKEMKAHYGSVRNWPSMTPAVSSIFQSGCEQVEAANKESKQAGQEQEVFTVGREKIPLVSPTAGAE